MSSLSSRTNRHIASLDLLRVMLTLVIFLCHSAYFLSEKTNSYIGTLTGFSLELFFILSGFCAVVSKPSLEDHTIRTLPYLFQKFKRLWPLHFITYAACAVLQFLKAPEAFHLGEFLKLSFFNLTFLQSWFSNETFYYSFNGVTWFLSSLFFCYLLVPLTIRFLRRFQHHAVWLVLAAVVLRYLYVEGLLYFVKGSGFYVNVFPPYRFFEFFAGMALGAAYTQTTARIKASWVQVLAAVSFLAAFILSKFNRTVGTIDTLFIVFELVLVYALSFYTGIADGIARTRPVQFFNRISMAFFLLHQVVIKYVRWLTTLWQWDLSQVLLPSLAVIAVLIVLLSWCYDAVSTALSKKIRH